MWDSESLRGTVDGARMIWKRLLSYRRQEWGLSDYPIRVRVQTDAAPKDRYWVRVLGWLIDATGPTPEDAMVELRSLFEARKTVFAQEGKPQPRPGTRVPIEFAVQEKVSAHANLRDDFIHRVLGFEWAFISDESSLWDFHTDVDSGALNAKIEEVYGVDVSDIESGNIAEILQRIASVRGEQKPSRI